jgi:hypothetical protein
VTEIEKAFNQGVDECARVLEAAARSIPPQHAVTAKGLEELADDMRGLALGTRLSIGVEAT